MACTQVPTCPPGLTCYDREIDCRCGGCPDGGLDPNSETCKCKDTGCAAPKVPRVPAGAAECACVCETQCTQEPKTAQNENCECICPPAACDATKGLGPDGNCDCVCTDTEKVQCTQNGQTSCVPKNCPDGPNGKPGAIDPATCSCIECAQPNLLVNSFCCPPLEEGKERMSTVSNPCRQCSRCRDDQLRDNDSPFCADGSCCPCKECPEDTHVVAANGHCVEKCEIQFPNTGKVLNDEGVCACPADKFENSNGVCVPCPVDQYFGVSLILGTHELCNGQCLPKCTDSKLRRPDTPTGCGCVCPPNKLIDDNSECQPCPVDKDGQPGTHEICQSSCYSKCTEGKVRAVNDCGCYCPPDTVYTPTDPDDPNNGGSCVPVKYSCIDGSCVVDPSGAYSTLTLCNQNCGSSSSKPCSPIPKLPRGLPILCADGVTQIGITLYPTFNIATCSWQSRDVYFGNLCPEPGSSTSGSSTTVPACCSSANPGPLEFKVICGGIVVPSKITDYTAPCNGHYTNLSWCDTCLDGAPVLRRTDTYLFNTGTCQFELFMQTPDVQGCPPPDNGGGSSGGGGGGGGSSSGGGGGGGSSGGGGGSSSGGSSAGRSSTQSSSSRAPSGSSHVGGGESSGSSSAGAGSGGGSGQSSATGGTSSGGSGGSGGGGGVEFFCGTCIWIWTGTAWELKKHWDYKQLHGSSSNIDVNAIVKCSGPLASTCDCNPPSATGPAPSVGFLRQTSCFEKTAQSSSSCSASAPPCACYMTVIPAGGCPEYYCLPDETCCTSIFGQAFDGGNAGTTCNAPIDLGGAGGGAAGCLICSTGACACEYIDGGNSAGGHTTAQDGGTALGCVTV